MKWNLILADWLIMLKCVYIVNQKKMWSIYGNRSVNLVMKFQLSKIKFVEQKFQANRSIKTKMEKVLHHVCTK